jgi:hypothetical protein
MWESQCWHLTDRRSQLSSCSVWAWRGRESPHPLSQGTVIYWHWLSCSCITRHRMYFLPLPVINKSTAKGTLYASCEIVALLENFIDRSVNKIFPESYDIAANYTPVAPRSSTCKHTICIYMYTESVPYTQDEIKVVTGADPGILQRCCTIMFCFQKGMGWVAPL